MPAKARSKREEQRARGDFRRAKAAEAQYAQQLKKIARHVGDIIRGLDPDSFVGSMEVQAALQRYAHLIEPWAAAVSRRMLTEVAARDRESWKAIAADMGTALHREIDTAPIGQAFRSLMTIQIGLIKSIPLKAAERVHELSMEALYTSSRGEEIRAELMRSGEVTKARAELIARTEVSRASTTLTQVRAQHIGSTHFVWRSVHDSRTRPMHRALNNTVHRWDQPPLCDEPDHHALPGCIWNCRCWAKPIIPE